MIKSISADKLEFLRNELPLWEEANILDREHGRMLVEQYQPASSNSSLISILSLIGAALIGLSMIASVATNSSSTPEKWVLFSIAIMLFVATFVLGWRLMPKAGGRAMAEATLVLSCTMYASAIATITQLFHYSYSSNWEALLFALTCGGMALATRSQSALLAGNAAVVFWAYTAQAVPDVYKVIVCAGALALAYHFRNRWALACALAAFGYMLLCICPSNAYACPIFGATLLAWHAWHVQSKSLKSMATPYLVVGLAAIDFSACFNSYPSAVPIIPLWAVGFMTTIAVCATLKVPFHRIRAGFAAALMVAALSISSQFAGPPLMGNAPLFYAYSADPMLLNMGYGVAVFSFIYCAHMAQNRWFLSIPLFALGAVCFRYLQEGKFAEASVGFLIVGAIALLAAMLLRRSEPSVTTSQQISR